MIETEVWPEPVTIAAAMARAIDVVWQQRTQERFSDYLKSRPSDRWQIFSDYSLSAEDRANDVFAFTALPGGEYHSSLLHDIEEGLTADFKKVTEINVDMARMLNDQRLFTVCFLLDKERKRLFTLPAVREMLDRGVAVCASTEPTPRRQALLRALKRVKQEAMAKNFNVRQFENILLTCGFAAFLSREICRVMHPRAIGWFSDRDVIVDAYQGVAHCFYNQNLADLMEPISDGWRGPDLIATNESRASSETPWSDVYTRVPDYFAGAIAPIDISRTDVKLPDALKYVQLFQHAISRNPNLTLLRFSPRLADGNYQFATELVKFAQRTGPMD